VGRVRLGPRRQGDRSSATALAALRQGEEHRVNEYAVALESADIHPGCQNLVRADLLPACHKHIEELDRLLGGMNR
jgi:hypothetical protein